MALPADYRTRCADEKLALLWAAVSAQPYADDALPSDNPGVWARRKLFSVAFNRTSFEHVSDVMPPGRDKLVHAFGTTAPIEIEIDEAHGFTGMFAESGPGLMRFSDAVGGGTIPSMAIKFFCDGGPSLNYFALPYARREPDNRNPLQGVYANATVTPEDLGAKAVACSFQRTAEALEGKRLYATYLPLHHLAARGRTAVVEGDPKTPDRLELHGTAQGREAMAAHSDWRRGLASIPKGTRIFELRVAAEIDQPALPCGAITLTEPFVASAYGDTELFFRHDVGPT